MPLGGIAITLSAIVSGVIIVLSGLTFGVAGAVIAVVVLLAIPFIVIGIASGDPLGVIFGVKCR